MSTVTAQTSPSTAVTTVTTTEQLLPVESPSPTAIPNPSPSDSPEALCNTSELSITLDNQQGAAGSRLFDLTFTNTGSTECALQGFPGVSLVGFQNGTQIGAPADREPTATPVVQLQPGESTIAGLKLSRAENYDLDFCSPADVDGLRIYPPGETRAAFIHRADITGCTNEAVSLLSIKAVGS